MRISTRFQSLQDMPKLCPVCRAAAAAWAAGGEALCAL